MKNKMNTIKNIKLESGFSPKIETTTALFITKFSYENSAKKNTTAELIKNKTIKVCTLVK